MQPGSQGRQFQQTPSPDQMGHLYNMVVCGGPLKPRLHRPHKRTMDPSAQRNVQRATPCHLNTLQSRGGIKMEWEEVSKSSPPPSTQNNCSEGNPLSQCDTKWSRVLLEGGKGRESLLLQPTQFTGACIQHGSLKLSFYHGPWMCFLPAIVFLFLNFRWMPWNVG